MQTRNSPQNNSIKTKKKLPWVWIIAGSGCLLILVVGGLILALIGMGLLFNLSGQDMEIKQSDKEALLTVSTIKNWVPNMKIDLAKETFTKQKFFDDSVDLDYTYDASESTFPAYVNSSITVEPNAKDASLSYDSLKVGMKIGLSLGGNGDFKEVERNDLLKWGDESFCSLLYVDGNPVGNFFITREGNRIYYSLFSGIYFDNPEYLEQLLTPYLKNLSTYNP